MPKKKIRQPTLLLRTALFTDGLRAETGLSASKIERRVRQNQYDRFGLGAPEEDTVKDYFSLYRSIAFEPQQTDVHAPWLVAAEREFPGCSYRYFHPLIDLMYGPLESSAFWKDHFRKIPEGWIEEAERDGHIELAQEWKLMNAALKVRKHRAKQPSVYPDHLSFLHLTMMRLPASISGELFTRKGLARRWARTYSTVPEDFLYLKRAPASDAMAALVALTKEAAEIGDIERFRSAKAAALENIPHLKNDPACRRIHKLLANAVLEHLEQVFPRRYDCTFHHGFGAPASWRAMLNESNFQKTTERYLAKLVARNPD